MKFQFERNPNEPLLDVELLTGSDRTCEEPEFLVTDQDGNEVDCMMFYNRLVRVAESLQDFEPY